MQLSDFQKLLIQKILNGEIVDTYTFVSAASVKLWGGDYSQGDYTIYTDYRIRPGDHINRVPNQYEEEITNQFRVFIATWDYLEKLGFIKTLEMLQFKVRILNIFTESSQPHYSLISLIHPYFHKRIAVLPPLRDFVDRNYLTEAEFLHQEEVNKWESEAHDRQLALGEERIARRTAQRWTIGIGITTIVLGLITTVFQYVTYKTDRNVTITNPNIFRDTTKVLLLNQEHGHAVDSLNKDSLRNQHGKTE